MLIYANTKVKVRAHVLSKFCERVCLSRRSVMTQTDSPRRAIDNLEEARGECVLELLLLLDAFFAAHGATGFVHAVIAAESRLEIADELPMALEGFNRTSTVPDLFELLAMPQDALTAGLRIADTTEYLSESYERIAKDFGRHASFELWNLEDPWDPPPANLDAFDEQLNNWLIDNEDAGFGARSFRGDVERYGASFDSQRSIAEKLRPRVHVNPTREAYRRLGAIKKPLSRTVELLSQACMPVVRKASRSTDLDAMFARSESSTELHKAISEIQDAGLRVNIITRQVTTHTVLQIDAEPYASSLQVPTFFNPRHTFKHQLPGADIYLSGLEEALIVTVPAEGVDHVPVTIKVFKTTEEEVARQK